MGDLLARADGSEVVVADWVPVFDTSALLAEFAALLADTIAAAV